MLSVDAKGWNFPPTFLARRKKPGNSTKFIEIRRKFSALNRPLLACFIHFRMPTARVSRCSSPSSFPHRLKREFLVRCYFSFTLFSEIEDECKDLMIFGLQTFLSSSSLRSTFFSLLSDKLGLERRARRREKRSIMGFLITGAREA
jgi:hypothetical protein